MYKGRRDTCTTVPSVTSCFERSINDGATKISFGWPQIFWPASHFFFLPGTIRGTRERERERDSSSLACRSKTTGKEDCIVSDDNNKQAREFH